MSQNFVKNFSRMVLKFSGYNPMEKSEMIENVVVRGKKKKYYRFRGTRFYGGIATADCVGCNLTCYFCWSDKPRKKPEEVGSFYSPKEVSEKIKRIAEKNDYYQARISGNEPTIGQNHLIKVLSLLESTDLHFILETNGILIGAEPSYAKDLSKFRDLRVRVSLKGINEEQFHKLTGAEPKYFNLQLKSLENLLNEGCLCHAAVMGEFAGSSEIVTLKERLREIDYSLPKSLEIEKLKLYPHVKKRLEKIGILQNNT